MIFLYFKGSLFSRHEKQKIDKKCYFINAVFINFIPSVACSIIVVSLVPLFTRDSTESLAGGLADCQR